MVAWQQAGVWERLQTLLLAELRAAGALEWLYAVADSSHVQAKRGAPRRGRARLTEPDAAPSSTSRGAGKTDAKDAYVIAEQARMRRDLTVLRDDDELIVELRTRTCR